MSSNPSSLTQQFFNANTLPAEPAIAEFAVRRESQMGRLHQAFNRAGITCHTGRKSVFIGTPTKEQQNQLKREGISDPHQRLFKCSPRKG